MITSDNKLVDKILGLYSKYKEELKDLEKKAIIFQKGKTCMLPFRTTEILYLLVRELKPEKIIEFSPHHGWSSFWILEALKRNENGKLYSFDLIDSAKHNLTEYQDQLEFFIGDVKEHLMEDLVDRCDFFYIDSEHTEEFARWYIEKILDVKKGNSGKTIWVSYEVLNYNGQLVRGYSPWSKTQKEFLSMYILIEE